MNDSLTDFKREAAATMAEARRQAVTGVVAPQEAEALIREAWPSLASWPLVARTARILTRSIIGAPLAWLLLLLPFALKIFPLIAKRYTLTNRRLMVRRGLRIQPVQEVALAEIDDVRVRTDDNSDFFRAGALDIISKGRVILTLPAVPEPESFRLAVINAYRAWVPGKASGGAFVPAKAASAP
jgi:hypothetical protein